MLSELQASEARYERVQERTMKNMGWGETEHCLSLTSELLPRLSKAIAEKKQQPVGGANSLHTIFDKVVELDDDLLALLALQGTFLSIVIDPHVRNVAMGLGKQLDNELFGKVFRTMEELSPKQRKAIERKVLKKHGSNKYRMAAVRRAARVRGLLSPRQLTVVERAAAGGWLLEVVLATLPEIFTTFEVKGKTPKHPPQRYVTLTDGAMERLDELADIAVTRNPVFLPSLEAPAPWRSLYHDESVGGRIKTLVRSVHNETRAVIEAAIESGEMQPTLDAVNHAQETAFKINTRILDVMLHCINKKIDVPGLPPSEDIPRQPRPQGEMTREQSILWRRQVAQTLAANRDYRAQRINLAVDMETAKVLAAQPVFWTLHSIDWRGRLYPMPHFNFQREDHIRALFFFRDGKPIGERGLWWLKVHLANCGDFGKISKRSFEERVAWVDEHLPYDIKAVVIVNRLWIWTLYRRARGTPLGGARRERARPHGAL